MGIKLLFFTGFSKFVAHESVAFMFVLFSCYSRCLLIFFFGGGYSGSVRKPCGYVMLIRASELSLRKIKKITIQ